MRFELFIATRYLRAKRRQAFIGIITGISIAGVAAGVASLIVALAVNNGFRQDLQDRLLGSTAHISLLRVESDGIRDWRPLLDKSVERAARRRGRSGDLRAGADFARPARPRRCAQGHVAALRAQGQRSAADGDDWLSCRVGGKPDRSAGALAGSRGGRLARRSGQATTLAPHHPPTTSPAFTRAWPPCLRSSSARTWPTKSAQPSDSVVLVTSPQGELTPFGMVPKYIRFRVVGIFNSGFFDYDSSWAFIRLADAQELFGLGDVISVIQFKLDDIYRAPEVGQELEKAADSISESRGFMATNWMEQNKPLFHALRLERLVTFITIGLIVFVAALNILISLTMMVMEKTKDIAVLMSMGTKKRQIRRIFIAQGMLIGVIGTAIGLVLGYAISWAGGHYHFISLAPEVYSIDYVPFAPRGMDGLIVALVSIGISFVATIYPSWAASRILPAEALRYE